MGKPRGYIICLLLGLLLGHVTGVFIGLMFGHRAVRVEAIKAGHARYMITDEYGNAQFEWIPVPTEKK